MNLAATSDGLSIPNPVVTSMTRNALGLGAVAVGGGVTGYLASGDRKGAVIGATTHVALLSLLGALLGIGQPMTSRVILGVIGLVSGSTTAYLFLQRRR